jgi:hypothetical protein
MQWGSIAKGRAAVAASGTVAHLGESIACLKALDMQSQHLWEVGDAHLLHSLMACSAPAVHQPLTNRKGSFG